MKAACTALADTKEMRRRDKLEHIGMMTKVASRTSPSQFLTEVSLPDILYNLRPLLADKDMPIRAAVYRTVRYLVVDSESFQALLDKWLHVYICRSLEKDSKNLDERMQGASTTIFAFFSSDSLSSNLSPNL
jgi:hypothetical protein